MKYLCAILLILRAYLCQAQELQVKDFVLEQMDLTAKTYPQEDSLGNVCALIKAEFSFPELKFEGAGVCEVFFKTNEYWVYVSPHSTDVKIVCPNGASLIINFKDFSLNCLESGLTYSVTFQPIDIKYVMNVEPESIEDLILKSQKASDEGNRDLAFSYRKAAADLGDAKMAFIVGIVYENSDKTLCFTYLKKAAEQGYWDAKYCLASLYITQNDFKKAVYWLEKCISKEGRLGMKEYGEEQFYVGNIGDALFILADIYSRGLQIPRNMQRAKILLEEGAAMNHIASQSYLGEVYEYIEHDMEKAVFWYKKAAANGDENSQKNLQRLNILEE